MLRAIATLLGLTLLAPAAMAASDQVTDFTLDNGMDVVVIEDHRAPVAVHMVWYRAGAADEPPGVSGVAHYLEHLMFKGTDTLEPGEFSATVARQGGKDNAFTSQDYTGYYQRVAADRLDLMMRMEADRMMNLRLAGKDIVTERDVILEERNQRVENDPAALFREQKQAAQYLNHPYGIPIIGWRAEMEELSREDVLAFYRTYYAPNNAILVVAGDVTPDEVRTLAQKHYGALPANPDLEPRSRPQEPPQTAERRLVMRDARVGTPYLSRSYLAPERDSGAQEKAAALSLLSDLLGGGQTSVLAEKLQFDASVAVHTAAYYSGTSLDDTTFDLIIVPADGVSLQQAEEALDSALAEFMSDGVDAQELERIKLQARASQIYARDNVQRLARRYGGALTQGLTVEDVQAWPDIIQSVTADDIMAAARDVLNKRHAVTGYLDKEEVTQ
ncbi:MAG: insulinase family protein [Sediminimonas qiaohouensis]|uniref:Insulinase family protein n=1 Tax=Sediminimonas qiaohouensis TaxID=552061 RepID=A0A7C9LSK1_9RHOB|nr:pitrilysin family protein [Sediminimonas qiaohouensis]MTJ05076.1 insulinase family protein [Sediminimonas qiaohouensis]